MTRGKSWLKWASICAVLFNVMAISAHYWLAHKFVISEQLQPGLAIGPVAGATLTGDTVSESSINSFTCHVIRYTSIHCGWCRRDEPFWTRFDETLRSHGCDTTTLSPSGADLAPNGVYTPNRRSFAIVPAYFIKKLDLRATPTTIVLDRNWKIVWSNLGILKSGDTEKALSSLGM
jgi:hypothetical protein